MKKRIHIFILFLFIFFASIFLIARIYSINKIEEKNKEYVIPLFISSTTSFYHESEIESTVGITNEVENTTTTIKSNTTKKTVKTTIKSKTTKKPVKTTTKKKTTKQPVTTSSKNIIELKRSNGKILKLDLEDYVVGVVAAEMPAEFHEEALKAQAIIARTYAMKLKKRKVILTDNNSTQNYKSDDELKKLWTSSYSKYIKKIRNAVNSTRGMYLTYKGDIVDAVYHSTSNGKTENARYVWNNSVPYLVSVESKYDKINPKFEYKKSFTYEELSKLFSYNIDKNTNFDIIKYTTGNRVLKINIKDKSYTGVEVRTILKLRSASFKIKKDEKGIIITTYGYGHGVGMSQYGAHGYAKNGYTYSKILKHYYPGVKISKN